MNVTEVKYKGFTICPAPNKLKDGSGWDHEFHIRQDTASGVTSRKITPVPDFFSNTKEEAVEACITAGKNFIEQRRKRLRRLFGMPRNENDAGWWVDESPHFDRRLVEGEAALRQVAAL